MNEKQDALHLAPVQEKTHLHHRPLRLLHPLVRRRLLQRPLLPSASTASQLRKAMLHSATRMLQALGLAQLRVQAAGKANILTQGNLRLWLEVSK